jgi:hypothetical protein
LSVLCTGGHRTTDRPKRTGQEQQKTVPEDINVFRHSEWMTARV